MSTARPRIGLTATADGSARGGGVRRTYLNAVMAAGGEPVIIPASWTQELVREQYGRLDGLLLPGGVDVAPEEYGEERLPELGRVDAALDDLELALARKALEDDLPVLAICRGIQVLNVAAGGSLYQDIRAQIPGALDHVWRRGEPRDLRKHAITIRQGSRLRDITGAGALKVNSLHHQSVKQAAGGFQVVAAAPDGVVEAIESPGHRFVLGLQCHPEELFPTEPWAAALFRAFVEAAGAE